MIDKVLNSRWFGAALTAGFIALLVAVLLGLGGGMPLQPDLRARAGHTSELVPIERAQALFAPDGVARLGSLTNAVTAFHTTFFQPAPVVKPTPPTTRKAALVYQGFIETSAGRRQAYLKADDKLVVGAVGTKVLTHLVIADIGLRTLTLHGGSAQTNLLQFNVPKQVEIPVTP